MLDGDGGDLGDEDATDGIHDRRVHAPDVKLDVVAGGAIQRHAEATREVVERPGVVHVQVAVRMRRGDGARLGIGLAAPMREPAPQRVQELVPSHSC